MPIPCPRLLAQVVYHLQKHARCQTFTNTKNYRFCTINYSSEGIVLPRSYTKMLAYFLIWLRTCRMKQSVTTNTEVVFFITLVSLFSPSQWTFWLVLLILFDLIFSYNEYLYFTESLTVDCFNSWLFSQKQAAYLPKVTSAEVDTAVKSFKA